MDFLPLALLGPATHAWKGIPDGFLDLDAVLKNRTK
jgi:hypothetical protein